MFKNYLVDAEVVDLTTVWLNAKLNSWERALTFKLPLQH